MFATLIGSVMILAAADDALVKEPPAKKELFAKEDWYKSAEGKEREFVGTLKYKPRAKDVIGFGRFNPFSLEMGGKEGTREVYVGGKDDLLKAYAGKRVKLIGKAVDMEVEGKNHREIWPARLEVVADDKKADPIPKRGIDDLKKKPAKLVILETDGVP